MSLNSEQRAFMRKWLQRSIARMRALPASEQHELSLRILQRELQRFQEAPQLRLIAGGRS